MLTLVYIPSIISLLQFIEDWHRLFNAFIHQRGVVSYSLWTKSRGQKFVHKFPAWVVSIAQKHACKVVAKGEKGMTLVGGLLSKEFALAECDAC